MNKLGLKIISDFHDYYDGEESAEEYIEYRRIVKETQSRWKELNDLRIKTGVRTIEIATTSEIYANNSELLVLYIEPNGHGKESKILLRKSEAMLGYPYTMCSKYHTEASGITFKFLQVGKRRFNIVLKNYTGNALFDEGNILEIKELVHGYDYMIKEPLYSIDYIRTAEGEIAVDFDRYPNLSKLNFQNVMSANEVREEIIETLRHYNTL